ncbi:unnamed protein product [Caenorhabditis brenneri]
MNIFLQFSAILLFIFVQKTNANASLIFGDATQQNPGVSLTAVNDSGRLVQIVTWTFQASQCEVLTRTDETISSRAMIVSLTSSCINRNVCNNRGPVSTPINCDEFMRRLT